ncbi:MAG: sortase [Patescibacteria group bacterium]
MALYAYKKSLNPKRDIFVKKASKASIFVGIILMIWAFYPVISFELYSKLFITNGYSTPIPSGTGDEQIENPKGVILGQNITDSNNLRDYTKASTWFTTTTNIVKKTDINVNNYLLSIPKLNINDANVVVGGEDLKKSLIQFVPTSLPGENGNAVILGHSTLPQLYNTKDYKTIFTYLPSLNEGDMINIKIGNENYEYKVYEMFVVKPDKVSVLDQNYDASFLTLITCVPPGTYWNRLVVRAKLVNTLGEF